MPSNRLYNTMSSLQKGDLFITETTEITETKYNFIFHQKK
jgi:hypothetical protein